MVLFQDSPVAFLLSTAVLLITASSFLAISVSLHSAYLWLTLVCVTLIFLATFTCTYSLPGHVIVRCDDAARPPPAPDQESAAHVFWLSVVDLPPPYEAVAGVHAQPPSYSTATSGLLKMAAIDDTTADKPPHYTPQPLLLPLNATDPTTS